MNTKRLIVPLLLFTLLLPTTGCTPKAAIPPTAFTSSVKANDDIATSIKILIRAESDLEQQSPPLLTPAEGLKIIDGLAALNAANIQYGADLAAAKAAGNKSALKPSVRALRNAVSELNNNGVLGIKSEKAKQIFKVTMAAIDVSLASLEAFATSP